MKFIPDNTKNRSPLNLKKFGRVFETKKTSLFQEYHNMCRALEERHEKEKQELNQEVIEIKAQVRELHVFWQMTFSIGCYWAKTDVIWHKNFTIMEFRSK